MLCIWRTYLASPLQFREQNYMESCSSLLLLNRVLTMHSTCGVNLHISYTFLQRKSNWNVSQWLWKYVVILGILKLRESCISRTYVLNSPGYLSSCSCSRQFWVRNKGESWYEIFYFSGNCSFGMRMTLPKHSIQFRQNDTLKSFLWLFFSSFRKAFPKRLYHQRCFQIHSLDQLARSSSL